MTKITFISVQARFMIVMINCMRFLIKATALNSQTIGIQEDYEELKFELGHVESDVWEYVGPEGGQDDEADKV